MPRSFVQRVKRAQVCTFLDRIARARQVWSACATAQQLAEVDEGVRCAERGACVIGIVFCKFLKAMEVPTAFIPTEGPACTSERVESFRTDQRQETREAHRQIFTQHHMYHKRFEEFILVEINERTMNNEQSTALLGSEGRERRP